MFLIDDILEIGMLIAVVVNALEVLGKVIMAIAKAFGLVEKEENVDELGDKAIQAEESGITPDQFDNYDEYVKAVENFEVDPAKSKEISTEDKVKKGLEILAEGAKEKYGLEPETTIGMLDLATQNPKFFTECSVMIANAVKENPAFVGALGAYLKGQEQNEAKLTAMTDKLTEMEKAAHPEMSDLEARRAVHEMRNK